VQDVAFVELQVSVAEPPLGTAPALVDKLTLGTPAPDTVTGTVARLLLPAGP